MFWHLCYLSSVRRDQISVVELLWVALTVHVDFVDLVVLWGQRTSEVTVLRTSNLLKQRDLGNVMCFSSHFEHL